MKLLYSLGIGYLMGCISPSAFFSRKKNVNMKEEGTKNLGASNAALVLGKGYGVLIMALDIFKSILAGRIARFLFPSVLVAGMVACLGAILGHIFPFHMGFEGGKGLACYGGMVLFYNIRLFFFYLTFGVGLMLLCNRSVILPLFVALSFPVIVWLTSHDFAFLAVSLAASLVLLLVHRDNFGRVSRGEEAPFRKIVAYMFRKK